MDDSQAARTLFLAVGALHVDDMATPLGSLIPKASNPVRWSRLVGGVAAKTLLAAKQARPAIAAHLLSAMGNDALGAALTDKVEQFGVILNPVHLSDRPTGRYTVIVDTLGELFVGLADVNLSESIRFDQVLSAIQRIQPQVLLVDANLSADCLEQLAEQVAEWRRQPSTEQPAPLVAAMAVSPAKSLRLRNLAPVIDLLFCNRREAAALTERDSDSDLGVLGNALVGPGFNDIVLTDAGDAVWIREAQQAELIEVPEQAIERTVNGAGDALAGATLAHWSAGKSLGDCVRHAGLRAARSVLEGSAHTYALDSSETLTS